MNYVGLEESIIHRYPHELSGGQRQRAVIARALVLKPDFIVGDEPVSALDVSIRSQVLNLMKDMKRDFHLSLLFISHDMSVVRFMCDRILVMYLGKIVEEAPKDLLFSNPLHPYTKALLSAVPIPETGSRRRKNRFVIEGDPPNPMNIPAGCRFHTRCPYASDICSQQSPGLKEQEGGHFVACHLYAGSK